MMTLAIAIQLVVLTSANNLVSEDPYFGKSPSQVIAMGREAWMDFYTQKSGLSSTYAMAEGMTLFGRASQKINSSKIIKLSKPKQMWYREFRAKLTRFAVDSNKIGVAITGGGTIWTNINAGILADIEEVVAESLGGTITYPDLQVSVKSALQNLARKVNTVATDIDISKARSGYSAAECRKIISSLKAQVVAFQPLIKSSSTGVRGLIESFLIKTLVSTVNVGKIN